MTATHRPEGPHCTWASRRPWAVIGVRTTAYLPHERRAFSAKERALRRGRLLLECSVEELRRLVEVAERCMELRIGRERIWVATHELALRDRVELIEARDSATAQRDCKRAIDVDDRRR